MRRFVLVVVLACSAPKAPAPATRALAIAPHPPRVGHTTHERVHCVQRISVKNGAEAQPTRVIDETTSYDETVEAVAGLAITRATAHVSRASNDGGDAPHTTKWHLVATNDNGVVMLRDDSGAPLAEDSAKDLHDHFRALGRPDPFLVHAPAAPLKTGARVPELEEALRERFMRADAEVEGHILSARVTVRDADPRAGEASLNWSARIAGRQYGFAFEGTLDGTMRIRRDGLLDHIAFVGHGHGVAKGGATIALEQTEVHDYTYEEGTPAR